MLHTLRKAQSDSYGAAVLHLFCFISWRISRLYCFVHSVTYAGMLPRSLIAKTRPAHTLFRKTSPQLRYEAFAEAKMKRKRQKPLA